MDCLKRSTTDSTANFAYHAGDKTINVKTRKGFLRLALQYGVDILPCFCFGETKLHDLFTAPGADFIKRKLRIGLIWPIGRFYRGAIR